MRSLPANASVLVSERGRGYGVMSNKVPQLLHRAPQPVPCERVRVIDRAPLSLFHQQSRCSERGPLAIACRHATNACLTRRCAEVLTSRDGLLPWQRPLSASWDACLRADESAEEGEGWARVMWSEEDAARFMREHAPAYFLPVYLAYTHASERTVHNLT